MIHTAGPRGARHRGEAGFTLVELLVVVVILGILSAVVVFAVRGAGGKGEEAAIATDERTIRAAEEAYCAQRGTYAEMGTALEPNTLVGERFLSDPSRYHKVDFKPSPDGGPCNGTGFEIKCADGSAPPNCGGAQPTNTSTSTSTSQPASTTTTTTAQPVGVGGWTATGGLPDDVGNRWDSPWVVAMDGTGSIVNAGGGSPSYRPMTYKAPTQKWDVSVRPWTVPGTTLVPKRAVAIPGQPSPNCPDCGKVLIQLTQWALYDPVGDGVTPLPPSAVACNFGTKLQGLADGRVLKVGCGSGSPNVERRAEIFDPRTPLGSSPWKPATNSIHGHKVPLTVRLADDRVLVIGGGHEVLNDSFVPRCNNLCSRPTEIYDPVTGDWSDAAAAPFELGQRDSAVLLGDGRVLVIGYAGQFLLYQPGPGGGSWSSAGRCGCGLDDVVEGTVATVLPSGSVLVAGGSLGGTLGYTKAAALFNPTNNTWRPAAPMTSAMSGYSAHLLGGTSCDRDCGKVLLVGGAASPKTSLLFSESGAP